MNLFITGTDTNVGKTFVSSLLVRALRKGGLDCIGTKPICCGDRSDAEQLLAACDSAISIDDINPVWLRTPAAPYTAAIVENRMVDLSLIRETFARLRAAHRSLIVEGVGGWRVPIARDFFISDLAKEFALPVVVVVGNRLGAINHVLLTVDSIRANGCECAGVILNHTTSVETDIAGITNRGMIEDILKVPVLYEIAHGQKELVLAGGL